ncbi:dnaJ homolog subfamily C member 1-like [Xenia sp. Carnegie-2017]|uniref:dnaJ homolog subfamily C member 1-like n=1 Tax=Xenia sp. Carnegie-2017 TaxID=2897299 RepID=UPI001F04A066|nr:dnaJ homolog subfamily C member 1-like [Xenia sp. Carnegie-2017]
MILMKMNCIIFFLFILTSYNGIIKAWDDIDFQLFDMVEDIKMNFYDVLEVGKDATSSEIRRAYRQLSLKLHPDRSDDPHAEEKFRRLVSVAEVLKDDEKRKRYDAILKNGLPDWRQPVFYYRRVRKMGFLEFLLFIFIIFTVGHFIIAWSVYLERKFELDEVLTSFKKKKEKRNRKFLKQGGVTNDVQVEDMLDEEGVRKPTFWDLLPFVIYRFIVSSIQQARLRRELARQQKIEQHKLDEKERIERQKELENALKPKPRRQRVQHPGISSAEVAQWEGAPVTAQLSRGDGNHSNSTDIANGGIFSQSKDGEWNQEDLSKLSRLMVKYPGGTPGRWEKVALDMGRSVKDITSHVKQSKTMIKDQAIPHPADLTRLLPNKKASSLNDNIVTQAVCVDQDLTTSIDHQLKTNFNNVKDNETWETTDKGYNTVSTTKSNDSLWTQNQQKQFEKALATVPKDASDRWTQIAKNVPGKSKEECIARYKFLVEMLKKRKKEAKQNNET